MSRVDGITRRILCGDDALLGSGNCVVGHVCLCWCAVCWVEGHGGGEIGRGITVICGLRVLEDTCLSSTVPIMKIRRRSVHSIVLLSLNHESRGERI